ncbi:MAG TPA: serine acetyltransferase, partial [Sandaracinaceae bacterium LLY-WYZ-13_1]|nr:serine acetyltransferase [Sandaracinaceae bacterium LLY-WYZ-13_1]
MSVTAAPPATDPRHPSLAAEGDLSGERDQNPEGMSLWALWKEDWETHDRSLLEPGFWAVALHRFGNWRMRIRPKPLRAPLSVVYRSARRAVSWGWGIDLNYSTKLGRRVRLWHHGGMFLGARRIGDDVHIRHNVTLGVVHRDEGDKKPVLEDGCDIGSGAAILGEVRVGARSVVGANSVVVRSFPPDSVLFGVPARPVRTVHHHPEP